MVKALVIGDTHFKISNVRDTELMTTAILENAEKCKPDFIVLLGDILDGHETIHVSPLTRAVKFLASLCEIAPLYVLIGNHDLKNNRQFLSEEHPFTSLKYWDSKKIKIIDKVHKTTICEHTFVFSPYVPPGMFVEALNTVDDWFTSTAIFAHQEFKGAHMGAMESVYGDIWPADHPYVISGHVHDYQEPQINILYVGTPIQHTFGDNPEKTISIIEFENNTRKQERISLGIPKKQIIRIATTDVNDYNIPENMDLKIIITGTTAEIKTIMKHPNIDKWKKLGCKICYKDVPITDDGEKQLVEPGAPPKFSDSLYNAIKSNPNLEKVYGEIFTTPSPYIAFEANQPTQSSVSHPSKLKLLLS